MFKVNIKPPIVKQAVELSLLSPKREKDAKQLEDFENGKFSATLTMGGLTR